MSAQRPDVESFKNRIDFPVTEIRDMAQDLSGYIWIVSAQGLYRFDGHRFVCFGKKYGIDEDGLSSLFIDSDSSVWVSTVNSATWRIKDNLAVKQVTKGNYPLSKSRPQRLSYVKKSDTLMFYTMGGGVYQFFNDSLVGHGRTGVLESIIDMVNAQKEKWNPNISFFLQLNLDSLTNQSTFRRGNVIFCRNGIQTNLYAGNLHIYFNAKGVDFEFVDEDLYDVAVLDDLLLKSVYQTGLVVNNLVSNRIDTLFHGFDVSRIFIDRDKGVWIGTLQSGLYYIRNIYARNYYSQYNGTQGQYSDMFHFGDSLLLLDGNRLQYLDYVSGKVSNLLVLPFAPMDIVPFENGIILYDLRQIAIVKPMHKTWHIKSLFDKPTGVSQQVLAIEDKIFVASIRGLSFYTESKRELETLISTSRIYHLTAYKNNLYAIVDTLIWKWDNQLNSEIYYSLHTPNYLASDAEYIYTANENDGLVMMSGMEDTVRTFSAYTDVNHVMSNNGFVYISTPKGLYVEPVFNDSVAIVNEYDKATGLGGWNISKTCRLDSLLCILHESGLTIVPEKRNISKKLSIDVECADSIVQNGNLYRITLDRNRTHVQIFFNNFDYPSVGYGELYYRINGIEGQYVIQNNQLDFINLKSGLTTISVSHAPFSLSTDGDVIVEIYRKPALREIGWFQLLTIFLLAALIVYFIYTIIRKVKKRGIIESSKVAQMQTVLQQQMNPHFIFNSLTSINHYILQNEPMESSRYLTKFSTLIRNILDNSGERYVSLASELDALEGYLELELLRFQGRFSYNFKIDTNINKSQVLIPPFLIQPYVERALRDGVINNEGKGIIVIRIKKSGDKILCSILDNGVGLVVANRINQKKASLTWKSGTQIAKQRIDLYNATHIKKISLVLEDMFDHAENVSGTAVHITFPLKKH